MVLQSTTNYRCSIRLLNCSAGVGTSCSVEAGESCGLSLHVVPRHCGVCCTGGPAPRQHHLLAIIYRAVSAAVTRKSIILTKQDFWHKPMFACVEGWCCSPIIRKQFCCSETVPTMESCPMSMTPHEQHTLGRGPGRVVRSSLPQGVSLSPAASRKCHTR